MYFTFMIAGAAVVGFVGAYAASKGAQMAGGFPMTASAMKAWDGNSPIYGLGASARGVPGGYGKGSHPNLL
jgi:hypothetical protein